MSNRPPPSRSPRVPQEPFNTLDMEWYHRCADDRQISPPLAEFLILTSELGSFRSILYERLGKAETLLALMGWLAKKTPGLNIHSYALPKKGLSGYVKIVIDCEVTFNLDAIDCFYEILEASEDVVRTYDRFLGHEYYTFLIDASA